MVPLRCREHERLSFACGDAIRGFQAAHEELMSDPAHAPRQLAREAVRTAQRKKEATRIALLMHESDHKCFAAVASA
jgi:hypothetical protein